MATIEPYETAGGRRYRVRYRKPDNSQTSKRGFKMKREAELFLATTAIGISAGTYVDPAQSRANVGHIGDRWMRTRSGLKASSVVALESAWRLHVRPKWGNVAIGRVRFSDVEIWIAELKATTKNGKPMSASLIHRCHGFSSAFSM